MAERHIENLLRAGQSSTSGRETGIKLSAHTRSLNSHAGEYERYRLFQRLYSHDRTVIRNSDECADGFTSPDGLPAVAGP